MIITTCQYCSPKQDPRKERLNFCGKPVVPGKSYCEDHYPLMYRLGTSITGKRKTKELERKIKYIKAMEDMVDVE